MASSELASKIGHVPNLSLGPAPQPKSQQRYNTTDRTRRYDHLNNQAQGQNSTPLLAARMNQTPATLTNMSKPTSTGASITDFGLTPVRKPPSTIASMPSKQSLRTDTVIQSPQSPKSRKDEKSRSPDNTSPGTASNTDSSGNKTAANGNLTVANSSPIEKPDGDNYIPSWQTATEEKLRLRQMEAAKAKEDEVAEQSQPQSPPQTRPATTPPPQQQQQQQQKWLSAEEEKRKMFLQAQSRVEKTQTVLKAELEPTVRCIYIRFLIRF